MTTVIRIGTRESELAVWQATQVQQLLRQQNFSSELVFIKSEGDIDLHTPLYQMGVQGIFTKSLDIALLQNKIDIAVHSMKDVPTQLASGIVQAAVLQRANYKDLLVLNGSWANENNDYKAIDALLANEHLPCTIATSSIRRKAQWLHRYPHHTIGNLRGNINTRMRKVKESNWQGAIFAAAGLERINLRPENSVELDWMLPAPAQGAIMVVCRQTDEYCLDACSHLNDAETAICTKIERDFLRTLMGGCSTPISALARVQADTLFFQGNILSVDGTQKLDIEKHLPLKNTTDAGNMLALELLSKGGQEMLQAMQASKHHQ
jgi:hydroxymethylbilane synthase